MRNMSVVVLSFVIAAFLAPGTSFVPSVSAEIVDRIVAVVNDEPITQSEMDVQFMPIYDQYRQSYQGEELDTKLEEARGALLNQLVEDRLVYQESKKRELVIADEEVQQKVDEIKGRFATEDEFIAKLREQGLTVKELKERCRQQIAVQKMYQYEVISKLTVSPSDIDAYYAGHKAEYTEPERVKVSTIMIKKNKDVEDFEATAVRFNDVMKLLQEQNAVFADVAKKYSEESHAQDGGALGFIKAGELIPALDAAIAKTEVGKLSEMVETDIGFHVFLVEARQEEKVTPIETVRDQIYAILYKERSEARYKSWIEELKQNAYISIK